MRRRNLLAGIPLFLLFPYKSFSKLKNKSKDESKSNLLELQNQCGRRVFSKCENMQLFRNYCTLYGIQIDSDISNRGRIEFSFSDVLDNADEILISKIYEASAHSCDLLLTGGGILNLNSEIELSISLYGDGKTKLLQKSKNKSLLVLTRNNLTVENVIITPSNDVNSITKAGIELRNVSHCSVNDVKIEYSGDKNHEGNGITINEGYQNTIFNCSFKGADLNKDVYHTQGGNDISVYGNASKNIVAFNKSVGHNIRGIFQLNDCLGKKCDNNIYIANLTDGALGYGHICYEKRHGNNTSMSGTKFLRGEVRNISGSVKIPNGRYKDKKVFGIGVYNQAGRYTEIQDYLVENVCFDSELTELLPLSGIGSTAGDIVIEHNTIANTLYSGIKISNFFDNQKNKININNNSIENVNKNGVFILNCDDVVIKNTIFKNCNYAVNINPYTTSERKARTNKSTVQVLHSYSAETKGYMFQYCSVVSLNDFNSVNDSSFVFADDVDTLIIYDGVITNTTGVLFKIMNKCKEISINSIMIVGEHISLKLPKYSKVSNIFIKENK